MNTQILYLVKLYNQNLDKIYTHYLMENGQLKTGDDYRKGMNKFMKYDLDKWLKKQLEKNSINESDFYACLLDSL